MPRKPAAPTQQSRALVAAMKARNLGNVDIANAAGVTPGAVSHWVTGHRPVPPEKAQAVSDLLGIKAETISPRFAAIYTQAVPDIAANGEPSALTINRLENGIDAMRLALGVMAGVMLRHRPVEAADVAKTIRKKLPGKFVNQGFVKELLEVLEAGA